MAYDTDVDSSDIEAVGRAEKETKQASYSVSKWRDAMIMN